MPISAISVVRKLRDQRSSPIDFMFVNIASAVPRKTTAETIVKKNICTLREIGRVRVGQLVALEHVADPGVADVLVLVHDALRGGEVAGVVVQIRSAPRRPRLAGVGLPDLFALHDRGADRGRVADAHQREKIGAEDLRTRPAAVLATRGRGGSWRSRRGRAPSRAPPESARGS